MQTCGAAREMQGGSVSDSTRKCMIPHVFLPYDLFMTSVKIVTKYEATGQGALTAEDLQEVLKGFPPKALVSVTTESSQREGDWWRVSATVRT